MPLEILTQLPFFLHSLDDLYALLRTSRLFHHVCTTSRAKLPPTSKLDRRMVLIGTARQLAEWAGENHSNEQRLKQAMESGSSGLLELANQVALLDLRDTCYLQQARKTIIQPLADLLLFDCGKCGTQKFYQRHCTDITTALCDFVTYFDFLLCDVDRGVDKGSGKALLGAEICHRWVSTCIHDVGPQEDQHGLSPKQQLRNWTNLRSCHKLSKSVLDFFPLRVLALLPAHRCQNSRTCMILLCMKLFRYGGLVLLKIVFHEKLGDARELNQLSDHLEVVVTEARDSMEHVFAPNTSEAVRDNSCNGQRVCQGNCGQWHRCRWF